jgi:hypothetical protein
MTNIILSINGVLIGLITFSNLSLWSVCASVSIVLLGIYGFFFAGKHYERFKYHTSIMGAVRGEIDRLYLDPQAKKGHSKNCEMRVHQIILRNSHGTGIKERRMKMKGKR